MKVHAHKSVVKCNTKIQIMMNDNFLMTNSSIKGTGITVHSSKECFVLWWQNFSATVYDFKTKYFKWQGHLRWVEIPPDIDLKYLGQPCFMSSQDNEK